MSDIKIAAAYGVNSNMMARKTVSDRPGAVDEPGKSLPPEAANPTDPQEAKAKVAEAAVGQAVAELNDYVQSEKRDLFFSVEGKTGETVIRVVDRESGELIRQIPNQVVLDLAEMVKQNEPLQLINMQG